MQICMYIGTLCLYQGRGVPIPNFSTKCNYIIIRCTPWPQFAILCTVLLEIFTNSMKENLIHENFTLEMFTYQKVQLMIRTDS